MKIIETIKNLFAEPTEKKMAYKYSCTFKTVDGKTHEFNQFRYVVESSLVCSVQNYLFYRRERDGYFEDNEGIFYPIKNIVSVEWKLEDYFEAEVREYQVFVDKPAEV